MMMVPQKIWRWKIALYLYLAGLGAGSYLVANLAWWATGHPMARLGEALGVPIVAVGTLFLIWDLGRPNRFLGVFSRVSSSWISRGAWIILGFILVGGANVLMWLGPWAPIGLDPSLELALDALGLALAGATASYTGILLGVMGARPIWNNSALPLLFLASALSTGIGALLVVYAPLVWLYPESAGTSLTSLLEGLGKTDMGLILLEALVIYFYLAVAHAQARDSVAMLLNGPLAGLFWNGVVVTGLGLPLALEVIVLYLPERGPQIALASLAGLSLLAGGLALRAVLLGAGVRPPIRLVAQFHVRPGQ